MQDNLSICSWNVRGLKNHTRALRVKKWIHTSYNLETIICFQELKSDQTTADFHLNNIRAGCFRIYDKAENGWIGAALCIPSCYQVLESGAKGDGTVAWAKIQTYNGDLRIASVYAPNNRMARIDLWKWLLTLDKNDKWIFAGDWNMVDM